MKFRALRADEIDCRISTVCDGKGCSLLLYKDARCDQIILDETVGNLNWQRHHTRDNQNCIVAIWDDEKKQWIEKEDTGSESQTEKEKGLASDSFKRACFNWGIGRELYTAPFIWIKWNDVELDGRGKPKSNFTVADMEVENGKIIKLKIARNFSNTIVYSFGYGNTKLDKTPLKDTSNQETKKTPQQMCAALQKINNVSDNDFFGYIKQNYEKNNLSELSIEECRTLYEWLKKQAHNG